MARAPPSGFFDRYIVEDTDRNVLTLSGVAWAHRVGQNPLHSPAPGDLCNDRPASPHDIEGILAHAAPPTGRCRERRRPPYGVSCWHHGDIRASSEHLDAAREAADAIRTEAVPSVLFDLEQLRLSLPFSTGLHDLVGDLEDPEKRYDEIVRRYPGDHYWELVVSNFAACNALSVGDLGRAERAARRGLAAVPEGMFAFWTIADRCFLGVSVALQGRLDEGLPLFDEAWAAYTAMGLRTNGVNLLAGKAQALAEAGRVKEAATALADAQRELVTYQERHGEPLLLLADAVLRHARSDARSEVARAFSVAADLATTQGSHGVARRVRATAERLGYAI